MQTPDKLKDYAKLVGEQLRWKRARPVIEREIETHLLDQRDALMQKGMDEVAATEASISQMGDAIAIGTDLDRVHRPKPAWSIFVFVLLLLGIGVCVKLFLTSEGDFGQIQAERCIFAAVLGIGFMLVAYFADFTLIGKYPVIISAGIVALTVLSKVLSPRASNGIGFYSVFCLLAFPLAFVAILYRMHGRRYAGCAIAILFAGLECICCLLIPSVIGLLLVSVCALILLLYAGAQDWFGIGKKCALAVTIGIAALLLISILLFALSNPSLLHRLSVAINPSIDPMGAGWQTIMVRELISGAQLIGQGSASAETAAYVNGSMDTDFILTYLIHNLGWISFLIIMSIFLLLFIAGFRRCFKQKNTLGRMVSLAVLLTLLIQTIAYVTTNLGLPLCFSISLPLVSYGNTATVINMTLIGVMLSAFRTGSLVKDDTVLHRNRIFSKARRFLWSDGTLTVIFKRDISS